MLTLSVNVGDTVQIGPDPERGAVIKVLEKSGRKVRLVFYTSLTPIRHLGHGIIPERFTMGITGEPRRIL